MSRVERHAAEEAAKKGNKNKNKVKNVSRPVERIDFAVDESSENEYAKRVQAGSVKQAAKGGSASAAQAARTNAAQAGGAHARKGADPEFWKEDNGSTTKKKKRKGRVTPFGKFLNFIGTVIMLAAIVISLALALPSLTGLKSFVVVSGSMEPEIPVGSMVYSKEVNPKTLQPGDVIVFYTTNAIMNGATDGAANDVIPVTHRVVENNTETGEIITKGDANENNDLSPVMYNNVVGIVVKHVPKFGYIASPIATTTGKIAMVMIILAGYLLTEVGSRLRKKI